LAILYITRMSQKPPPSDKTITVVSTFIAEPLDHSIRFWLERMQLPHAVVFAPPFQLIQNLLDTTSPLASNSAGINVILLRWEDIAGNSAAAGDTVGEFIDALRACVNRNSIPHLLISCPASTLVTAANRECYSKWDATLVQTFAPQTNLRIIAASELQTLHQVSAVENSIGEQLALIPFSHGMFAVMGTVIARQLHLVSLPQYKVIVVDCDDTLWGGVCSEDGPLGVRLHRAHLALQKFILEQHHQGVLICLCSRNNEEDVEAVFHQRSDMPLQLEHIVASRINWAPKSENILSLATQLDLDTDCFIFIDDNPAECTQVRLHLPTVLTLQLPCEIKDYEAFIKRVWAFDRTYSTDEDRQRITWYANEHKREAVRDTSSSLQAFVDGLALNVEFVQVDEGNLSRASQLTFRVNQFNLSPLRRSEAELARLLREKTINGQLVDVRDRFGDYGLTGLMLFAPDEDALQVDTFLLSCRALGRGVEYRMLNELAAVAKSMGLAVITFRITPSGRNQPAQDFLDGQFGDYRTQDKRHYQVPIAVALAARHDFSILKGDKDEMTMADPHAPAQSEVIERNTVAANRSALLAWIATEMVDAESILAAIEDWRHEEQPAAAEPRVAPRTDLERQIATIWSDALALDTVGVRDNFFALGGDSLAMVRIIVQLYDVTGVEFPIEMFFEAPTIEEHAVKLAVFGLGDTTD